MVEATRSAARGLEAADLATTAGLRGHPSRCLRRPGPEP